MRAIVQDRESKRWLAVLLSNPPVNTDARGRAAICARSVARAGYRAR
jgi:hypothetical protein